MLLETICGWQLQQMENNLKSIQQIMRAADDNALTAYRDGGTGWTVVQVMCHLRDFEALFHERARLTVTEDMPDLPFPDPDELATEKAYHAQSASDVLAALQANRGEYIAYLRERDNSDWERPANHPTRGAFTLHDQLFLTAWHDALHIEQITRILSEKRA